MLILAGLLMVWEELVTFYKLTMQEKKEFPFFCFMFRYITLKSQNESSMKCYGEDGTARYSSLTNNQKSGNGATSQVHFLLGLLV